jgi:hypothetical protein
MWFGFTGFIGFQGSFFWRLVLLRSWVGRDERWIFLGRPMWL